MTNISLSGPLSVNLFWISNKKKQSKELQSFSGNLRTQLQIIWTKSGFYNNMEKEFSSSDRL